MGKTKKAAPERLRSLVLIRCETGYLVRNGNDDFAARPVDCDRWAFTTMAETLAFVRRRMKGADG